MFRAAVVYTPRLGSPPSSCIPAAGETNPTDLSRDERRARRSRSQPATPRMSRTPPRSIRPRGSSRIWWRETGPHVGGYWAGAGEGDQTPESEATQHLHRAQPTSSPLAESLVSDGVFLCRAYGGCRRNRRKNAGAFIPACLLLLFPVCFGDYVATGRRANRPIILVEVHGSVIYDTTGGYAKHMAVITF